MLRSTLSFSISLSRISPTRVRRSSGSKFSSSSCFSSTGICRLDGDGVGKLRGIVHARRGDHGVVIQALRELHVLLKQAGDLRDGLLDLRRRLGLVGNHFQRGAEKAFVGGNLHDLGALDAFHQHAEVAVRQAHALHDIGQRADGEDFVRLGIVDRSVVLRGEENLLVGGQRFFERAQGAFASHDERVHHLGEDDQIAHRHHGHALQFSLFSVKHGFRGIYAP